METRKISLNGFESGALFDLHIAFAVDDNFVKPATISIISIIENNSDLRVHFHLFIPSISTDNLNRLKQLILNHHELTIHIFDDSIFSGFQTLKDLPESMYYRLIIPAVLKDVTGRVLYLDADIICINSLNPLLNINFNGNSLAACVDGFVKNELSEYSISLGIENENAYFNSGVILYNINLWLENFSIYKFNELIKKKEYIFPDQDVLNIMFQGEVHYLPEKFNTFVKRQSDTDNTVLLHFAGEGKPWKKIVDQHKSYNKYYKISPWHSEPLALPENHKESKRYAKILRHEGKYAKSLYWFMNYVIKKCISK